MKTCPLEKCLDTDDFGKELSKKKGTLRMFPVLLISARLLYEISIGKMFEY
jgi:hypothetical protein